MFQSPLLITPKKLRLLGMGIFMTILFSSLIIWRELTQIKDRFKNFFNELFKLLTLNLYLLSFIGHLCVFVDNIDSFMPIISIFHFLTKPLLICGDLYMTIHDEYGICHYNQYLTLFCLFYVQLPLSHSKEIMLKTNYCWAVQMVHW